MQLTRNSIATTTGPSAWFTGTVFVDGDMVFPPTFIERLIAPMREAGAPGTFTKDILVANGHRRWARARPRTSGCWRSWPHWPS